MEVSVKLVARRAAVTRYWKVSRIEAVIVATAAVAAVAVMRVCRKIT